MEVAKSNVLKRNLKGVRSASATGRAPPVKNLLGKRNNSNSSHNLTGQNLIQKLNKPGTLGKNRTSRSASREKGYLSNPQNNLGSAKVKRVFQTVSSGGNLDENNSKLNNKRHSMPEYPSPERSKVKEVRVTNSAASNKK